jgi:hypothetical protein
MNASISSTSWRVAFVCLAGALVVGCGGGSMLDEGVEAAAGTTSATSSDATTSQVNPGVRSKRRDADPSVGGL